MIRLIAGIFLVLHLSGCSKTEIKPEDPDVLRIAFGSCISESKSPIWNQILAKNPDLFLFLGDNIYIKKKHLSDEYAITRYYNKIYESDLKRLLKEVKHYAIWDDHDYGPNDSDSSFKGREASLSAFNKQWPMNPRKTLSGGIASKTHLPGVTLLLTDNRWFRINPGSNRSSQMFGAEQLEWLKSELSNPVNPLILLVSGNQLLTSNSEIEALREYPEERNLLYNLISNSKAQIVILSGGRHFSEIIKRNINGKQVTELSSSPLSSEMEELEKILNEPYREAIYNELPNFGVLEINKGTSPYKISAAFYNLNGEEVIRYSLN